MIKLEIKWYYLLIVVIGVIILAYLYYQSNVNRSQNQKIISQLNLVVDSLSQKTTKSVVEYRERIKTNTKIVDKWNNIYTTDSFTSIDTLFLQAKTDINYLDTSLKKCDSALSNCLNLSNTQSELIKAYKSKKEPIFITYLGVGGSLNKDLIVQPTINAGIGINLSRLFKK